MNSIKQLPSYYEPKIPFFQKAFKSLGYDYNKAEYLGDGMYGVVFKYDNTVIKFTDQPSDAKICYSLIGKNLKYITNIFAVYKINNKDDTTFEYIIIKEYVNEINSSEYEEFKLIGGVFSRYVGKPSSQESYNKTIRAFSNRCMSSGYDRKIIKFYIGCSEEMLNNNIWIQDIEWYNVGKRDNGDYVLFDLGQNNNHGHIDIHNNNGMTVERIIREEIEKIICN